MHRTRSIRAAALLIFASCSMTSAQAAVTYTYTGNPFATVVTNGPTSPPQLYTTTDFVSGSFVLPSPLATNLTDSFVSPTSFQFSDGVQTISDSNINPAFQSEFEFSTDASGKIVAWTVNLGSVTSSIFAQILTSTSLFPGPPPSAPLDSGEQILCGPNSTPFSCVLGGDPFYQIEGFVNGSPGTWAVSNSVPEISTWAMMLLGIAGVGFAAHRRAAARIATA
jgi:hypothetical protein